MGWRFFGALCALVGAWWAMGCATGRVRSVYVADFEAVCPQPEADVLARRVPDLIADRLRRKEIAIIISRKALENSDVVVTGSVEKFMPAMGAQFISNPYAILSINVKVTHMGAKGTSISYERLYLKQVWVPPLGFLTPIVLTPIELIRRSVMAPWGGFSAFDSVVADRAARDICRNIRKQ